VEKLSINAFIGEHREHPYCLIVSIVKLTCGLPYELIFNPLVLELNSCFKGVVGGNCNERLSLHLSSDIYDVSQSCVCAEYCAKGAMSDALWVTIVLALQFPEHYIVQ